MKISSRYFELCRWWSEPGKIFLMQWMEIE